MMGGKWSVMRPLSTLTITINTFYIMFKGRVADLLIHTSTSYIITDTITFYIFMKNIINTTRINIYTQQSTMVTWVMVGRVAYLGPISTYPITINSLLYISRGRGTHIFRPRSMSSTINTSITPLVNTITTSIFYYIITMNIFSNRTRRN